MQAHWPPGVTVTPKLTEPGLMVQDSGSPRVVASIEQARPANPEYHIRMSVHGSEPFH